MHICSSWLGAGWQPAPRVALRNKWRCEGPSGSLQNRRSESMPMVAKRSLARCGALCTGEDIIRYRLVHFKLDCKLV
eukprot:COSAG02_NODE_65_length_42645_cov_26.951934_12_plen_77_part_00